MLCATVCLDLQVSFAKWILMIAFQIHVVMNPHVLIKSIPLSVYVLLDTQVTPVRRI